MSRFEGVALHRLDIAPAGVLARLFSSKGGAGGSPEYEGDGFKSATTNSEQASRERQAISNTLAEVISLLLS